MVRRTFRSLFEGAMAIVGSVMLAVPAVAPAYFAGGGRDAGKGNDCLVGYSGIDPDQVSLDGSRQIVECTDCDPACDEDGQLAADGSCTLRVGVCINQEGVDGCDPPFGLDTAKAKGRVKSLRGLEGRIDIAVPEALAGPVCAAFASVVVPVKNTRAGTKAGRATISLSGSAGTAKPGGYGRQTPKRVDHDRLTYVCLPRPAGVACPQSSTSTSSTSTSSTSTSTVEGSSSTSSSVTTTVTSSSSTTNTTICVATSGSFCDLGDGTVYDSATGLQWEKKRGLDHLRNPADLHDANNIYSWTGLCYVQYTKQCQPNAAAEQTCKQHTDPSEWTHGCEQCTEGQGGCVVDALNIGAITTVWNWLDQLNASGFGGHDDWRLPSESGCVDCYSGSPAFSCTACAAHELETILLSPHPCATSPCIDPIFGDTLHSNYWSSTPWGPNTSDAAYVVNFDVGFVTAVTKSHFGLVRAVRDAP